jgi:hypothetical protein
MWKVGIEKKYYDAAENHVGGQEIPGWPLRAGDKLQKQSKEKGATY